MAEMFKSVSDKNKDGNINDAKSDVLNAAKRQSSNVLVGALASSPTLSRMLKIGRGEAVPKTSDYKRYHEINCWLLENYKTAPEILRRRIIKDWTEFCVRNSISTKTFSEVAKSEVNMISVLGDMFENLYSIKNNKEVSPEAEYLAKRLLINAYVADAAINTFENHPVKVDWKVTQVKEGKEQEVEKQKLLLDNGDYYASAIVYEHGDEHNIYTPTETGMFESCSFERSESGKIINPSDYQEACMTSGICTDFFLDGLVELLYKAKWEDWQFDHESKTYTATYTDENGKHSVQFELKHDTEKRATSSSVVYPAGEEEIIECEKLNKITQTSECEGVKIISEMDFTGMTQEEFREQVDRYQDVIDEAQELQEAQENGGPSM